jgi:hypothetical protein
MFILEIDWSIDSDSIDFVFNRAGKLQQDGKLTAGTLVDVQPRYSYQH